MLELSKLMLKFDKNLYFAFTFQKEFIEDEIPIGIRRQNISVHEISKLFSDKAQCLRSITKAYSEPS